METALALILLTLVRLVLPVMLVLGIGILLARRHAAHR